MTVVCRVARLRLDVSSLSDDASLRGYGSKKAIYPLTIFVMIKVISPNGDGEWLVPNLFVNHTIA